MPIYNKLKDDLKEVDVIVAGGGAAGCVVAGRLSAADPDLSVLLIEGGENNYNKDNVINPSLFREHLYPNSKTAIFYKTNKAPQLAGREPVVPAGGLLGGGSSVNLMVYTRGQRSDFDSWKTPGWSAKEVLPFLKKLETYHGAGDKEHHGYDGPIHVSDGGFRVKKSEDDFMEAAAKCGYPEFKDLQDLESNNGMERWQRYVSPDGKRQDTAHTYVHPLIQDGNHPNLHVLCESKVVRVIFDDDKKAMGVEYTPNPDYQPVLNLSHHPKTVVKARKLVVVSSGACGSPPILERSGVGDPAVLEKASVPVVADIPGVGHDLQDHNLVFYPFRTALEPNETMDAILSGRVSRDHAIAQKMPILRWNTVDVAGKVRPTDEEVVALGPEFKKAWDRDFANEPNRPLMLYSLVSSYLGDQSTIEPGQYVSIATYTAYPYSRGAVHITGPEWSDRLNYDTGYFTDPHDIDLKKQTWAYKKQREIMRRTRMYRGELPVGHPQFPEGSKAACVNLIKDGYTNGVDSEIKDVEYSAEDDKAIEQFLRENVDTTWHVLGTCKMAPREEKGVVDKDLNVYGVRGLKVADMSIVPENVAANTMNTAVMVGEKAADIILGELGLERSPKGTPLLNGSAK